MDIRAEKSEKARELVEEAIFTVEELTGQTPEPKFINFDANYPSKYRAGGIVDPISNGVYITKSFPELKYRERDYTVTEHELDHIIHLSTVFNEELDQTYLRELESNIEELVGSVHDENFGLEFTLGGYAFEEYSGHVYTGNFEALAALNHEKVDSKELKDKIQHFEGLAEKEKRKHRIRHRNNEIEIHERNDFKTEVNGRFAYAVNEEAKTLLDNVEAPESLQEIRERVEVLNSKDFEVEAETNARMVEFFERTDMQDKNPYESGLEADELDYIGKRLENAEDFYRFGEDISDHLFESLETFYRLKEVYNKADVDNPGKKAAEQITQAGIERLEQM